MTDGRPSTFLRVRWVAQIVYSEIQYWCVGLTPESYHWKKGSAWDALGNHQRAAFHLSRFLRFADNALVRGRLAYCHARLSQWVEASREYERANQKHPHPEFAIGHAQAELRLGNKERAAQILAAVESTHPRLSQNDMEDAAFLREEIRHGWNPRQANDA